MNSAATTHRAAVRCRPAQRRRAELLKKLVISGALIAFLLFYVMSSPDHAADIFHTAWRSVVNLAHGVGHFLNKLAT
jgi:hypothetical protein